jgi:hypothetical protein
MLLAGDLRTTERPQNDQILGAPPGYRIEGQASVHPNSANGQGESEKLLTVDADNATGGACVARLSRSVPLIMAPCDRVDQSSLHCEGDGGRARIIGQSREGRAGGRVSRPCWWPNVKGLDETESHHTGALARLAEFGVTGNL